MADISIQQYTTGDISWTFADDLSGKLLRLVVFQDTPPAPIIQFIIDLGSQLVVSGSGYDEVTYTYNYSNTNAWGRSRYTLRNLTDDLVLDSGAFNIQYNPTGAGGTDPQESTNVVLDSVTTPIIYGNPDLIIEAPTVTINNGSNLGKIVADGSLLTNLPGGGGGSQNLQQVTDLGSTTTDTVTVGALNVSSTTIDSSGNVIVNGSGAYVSANIGALDNLYSNDTDTIAVQNILAAAGNSWSLQTNGNATVANLTTTGTIGNGSTWQINGDGLGTFNLEGNISCNTLTISNLNYNYSDSNFPNAVDTALNGYLSYIQSYGGNLPYILTTDGGVQGYDWGGDSNWTNSVTDVITGGFFNTISVNQISDGATWQIDTSGNGIFTNLTASGGIFPDATQTVLTGYINGNDAVSPIVDTGSLGNNGTLGGSGNLTIIVGPSSENAFQGDPGGGAYVTASDTGLPAGANPWRIRVRYNCGSQAGVNQRLFSYGSQFGTAAPGVFCGVGTAGTMDFYNWNGSTVWFGNTSVDDFAWHDLEWAYDGTTLYMYIDGTLDYSVAIAMNISLGGSLLLCRALDLTAFTAQATDFAIWDNTGGSGTPLCEYTLSEQTTGGSSGSGTATCSQPFQGTSYKKVLVYCDALNGSAEYDYPVAFTNPPIVTDTLSISTVTQSSITLAGTGQTGFITLEGY